jgi:uncharacterized lipoprotein YddW (UPF0748 family)
MVKAMVWMLVISFIGCWGQSQESKDLAELRGVWLTNVDSRVLESRKSIAEAMQFLADHHFNIVFPVVWNNAYTLYRSAVMDSMFGRVINPIYGERDPLAEVIAEAHQRNIAVVAWFEYGFAASYNENGGFILETKPEWAAKDVKGRLVAKNGFEWMNANHPEVRKFMLSLVSEVASGYEVDGVQGDDRMPAQPSTSGYDDFTVQLYRKVHDGYDPPYNQFDPEWLNWRARSLNLFGHALYDEVKKIDPRVLVTWAPSIYRWCYEEYLQDWPAWVAGGYSDVIIPQHYRYTIEEYKITLDSQLEVLGKIKKPNGFFYPGILISSGSYVIDEEHLSEALRYNRSRNIEGEVFFFYEGLRKNQDRLAEGLLNSFYKEPARLPFPVKFKQEK